jgi:hypothetical protein
MRSFGRIFGALFLGGLVLTGSGCGGNGTMHVKGRVTLDGNPVEGANVVFMPEREGRPASGLTNNEGFFELTTFQTGDGALPGSYLVLVTKKEASTEPPAEPGVKGKNAKNPLEEKPDRIKGKSLLPEEYGIQYKTPLRCTVPVQGVVPLELHSTPPSPGGS